MSDNVALSLTLTSTDYTVPLGIRICLDDQVVYETSHVASSTQIEHAVSDDDATHQLTFEMFGKTDQHTEIDQQGNIVSDAMLSISNIEIDGLDVNYVVQANTVYAHDFNGTRAPTQDRFFGDMGCNGVAKFEFSTPIYLWLLENM